MNIEDAETTVQTCISCNKRPANERYLECDMCLAHGRANRENNLRDVNTAKRAINSLRANIRSVSRDPEPIGSIFDKLLQL